MKSSIIPFCSQINKYIDRSKDCFLYDSEGKQYIDFESGDWAANLGHSNERISQAIKRQLDISIHDGLHFRNKTSEHLSECLLKKLSFKNGKSVFLNSGSEAVNLAITLAKTLTKRDKVLKLDCSYISAYGHGQIAPHNTCLLNIPIDDAESISNIPFSEIAAFIFEPGNSGSLVKFPKKEFITTLSSKVKQYDGILIANEVTTGFGRTGKWFGHQHYDFNPDMVTMGKALGNGYPISGVCINNEVSRSFDQSPFRYAQSHQNDPLGCVVGFEVIKILDDENLVQKSCEIGQYFFNELKRMQNKYPDLVSDVRGRGLMLALELNSEINTESIFFHLIEEGFVTGYKNNVLRFMPPLTIELSQINKLINMIDTLVSD